MPALVPLSPSARSRATGSKSRGQPQSKKTRIVRRRGRAKDAIESDDEIEREVGTDSESDPSSFDSASDSDTEPASEDVVPNGHPRVLARDTSQSPADVMPIGKQAPSNGEEAPTFFSATGNWSEMVAEENVNGPADLPVIDFQDFDGHPVDQPTSATSRSRRSHKATKKSATHAATAPVPSPSMPSAPTSVKEDHADSVDDEQPIASTSRRVSDASHPTRPAGQSARQAYQQRLETDPSYVPTVGEFWGHDDRLLDKDLRSLSGWWRGRWQGQGRGRGGFDRGFNMRGRGRGGFFGPQPTVQPQASEVSRMNGRDEEAPSGDLPPVEKPWTHDGFEEMRRKEDHRQAPHHSSYPSPPMRGGFGGFRGGRGGFIGGRGRGNFTRRGFSPSPPTRSRLNLPFIHPAGRPWFAMKPDRMWTKQYDGFLHFDPALKPRPGQGPGFRVRLPGKPGQIIRASPQSYRPVSSSAQPSRSSVIDSDDGEKIFIVRIPKRAGKEKAPEPAQEAPVAISQESFTTGVEPPIEDIFTVRPELQTRTAIRNSQAGFAPSLPPPVVPPAAPAVSHPAPPPQPARLSSAYSTTSPQPPSALAEEIPQHQPVQPFTEQQKGDGIKWSQAEEAILRYPPSESRVENVEIPASSDSRPAPPVLPPLQTTFSPIPQTTPPYGSPYSFGSTLPHGIAMSQHGMPYEVATGRPVYLQPPQPMYTPQPVVHSHMTPHGVPFVPGHIRHHSTVSPDFLAPSHTPPMNGFMDPSTGAPIFALPRQSSRIEIRAPTEQAGGKSGKADRRPSGLRTTAVAFEPSRSEDADQIESYFPSVNGVSADGPSYVLSAETDENRGSGSGQSLQSHALDPGVVAFSPYQQPYYYPEPYGYPGYVDMSQVAQYDMYPSDPHAPQSAVYY